MAAPGSLAETLSHLAQQALQCERLDAIGPVSPWALVAALAAPHYLYAFIWFCPGVWLRLFGKAKAVDAFALCGLIGKRESFIFCVA
jgi:hypothetical protein